MYDYKCPDCNEVKLQSDKNTRKINEVIDQVNALIQVNNETVDFIEDKANEVVSELAEIKVNEELGDIKTSLDNMEKKEIVSVTDFLLDGDTSHDVAINKAIEYAKNKGKKVYFPSGTYYIDSTINVPSGFTIYGENRDTSIIRFRGTNTACFRIEDESIFVNITDLAIYGIYNYNIDGIKVGNNCITGNSIYHCNFERLDIRKFGDDSIKVGKNSNSSTSIGIRIKDCYIKNNCNNGVYFEYVHGLSITGGAIEYNKNWNIYLGTECMETRITDINCNTSDYSIGGSIKTDSKTTTLDTLKISQCHFEANGENTAASYMLDINSNNYTIRNNYFRTTKTNSLGGIKTKNYNGEIINNIFRSMPVGVKIEQSATNYVLTLKKNLFSECTIDVDGEGVSRWTNLGTMDSMHVQEFQITLNSSETLAIPRPRNRNTVYSSYVQLLNTSADGIIYNEGCLKCSLISDMSNPTYSSAYGELDRGMGTSFSLNLPLYITSNFIYIQTNKITDCNLKLLVCIEWL